MPNDGKRCELVNGEVYMTPSPSRKRQQALGNTYLAQRAHTEEHKMGEVYFAPFDVVFGERNDLQPDPVFIRKDRLKVIRDAHIEGAPDLIVEVLARARLPTIGRRYACAGVSEI